MAPHTRLAATWLVAMSSTSRPSPAGAAKAIGLVPSSGSRPPNGTTPGLGVRRAEGHQAPAGHQHHVVGGGAVVAAAPDRDGSHAVALGQGRRQLGGEHARHLTGPVVAVHDGHRSVLGDDATVAAGG